MNNWKTTTAEGQSHKALYILTKGKQFPKRCGHPRGHVKSHLFQQQQPFEDQEPWSPSWRKCQIVSTKWKDSRFISCELWLPPDNIKNKSQYLTRTAVTIVRFQILLHLRSFQFVPIKTQIIKKQSLQPRNQASPNQTFLLFHGHNHFNKKQGLEIRTYSTLKKKTPPSY